MPDTTNYNALVGTRLEHGGEAEEPLGPGQYTSGDIDPNPDGTPIFWQQAGNALVVASITNPVPVAPPYLAAANDSVSAQVIAAATGGYTPYYYVAAASANQDSQVVKGSVGTLGWLLVESLVATVRFLKIYDKATGPTSGDTPKHIIPIPINGTSVGGIALMLPPQGGLFANGIGFRFTAAIGVADATAVTAGDCVVNLGYK